MKSKRVPQSEVKNLKGLCKIFKDYREKRDEFLKKQLIALFCAIIL